MKPVLRYLILPVAAILVLAPARRSEAGSDSKSKPADQEDVWPPRDTREWRQFSKLLKAVDHRDLKTVKVLIRQGVDVDGKKAGDGVAPAERPLARAAAHGDEKVVAALLEAGADPNWCCCSCVTALHRAILSKNPEIVRRILDAGADPKIPYDGETQTLDLAKKSGDQRILELVRRRLTGR